MTPAGLEELDLGAGELEVARRLGGSAGRRLGLGQGDDVFGQRQDVRGTLEQRDRRVEVAGPDRQPALPGERRRVRRARARAPSRTRPRQPPGRRCRRAGCRAAPRRRPTFSGGETGRRRGLPHRAQARRRACRAAPRGTRRGPASRGRPGSRASPRRPRRPRRSARARRGRRRRPPWPRRGSATARRPARPVSSASANRCSAELQPADPDQDQGVVGRQRRGPSRRPRPPVRRATDRRSRGPVGGARSRGRGARSASAGSAATSASSRAISATVGEVAAGGRLGRRIRRDGWRAALGCGGRSTATGGGDGGSPLAHPAVSRMNARGMVNRRVQAFMAWIRARGRDG